MRHALAIVALLSLPLVARAEGDDAETIAQNDGHTTADWGLKVLDKMERWKGGTTDDPLSRSLRRELEKLGRMEVGEGAGGFEPPPETASQPQPADDDSQFAALQDLMKKQQPLEQVKTSIWFLVINPRTGHREEVQRMIDERARTLTAQQQADLADYMGVRRSLAGASVSNRISRWTAYARSKPQSAFADLAGREVTYLQSVQKDLSTESHKSTGRFLAKVGIVLVVLALIVVIIFGASK